MSRAEERMAEALRGRSFGRIKPVAAEPAAPAAARPAPVAPPQAAPARQGAPTSASGRQAAAPLPPAPREELAEGQIHIGDTAFDRRVGIDLGRLLDGRLLIQGVSGAGKSWTLRRLLERTAGRLPQIIVDPEGEFRELAEHLGMPRADGARLDASALATLAARVREHRLSLLLDLSDLDPDGQLKAAAAFFAALTAAPREHWHPVLIVIDEAHLLAPWGGYSDATHVRKMAIAALTDLMNRGRKRGLIGVLATQRLARLAKSVASPVQNFMIGLNTLDLDIRRAADTIGWDARKAFDRLPLLAPGSFCAAGPAFSSSPAILKVGPVETAHRGAAPEIEASPARTAREAARLLDLETLAEATEADRSIIEDGAARLGLKRVRSFIRDAAFPDAARVWTAIKPLYPKGATLPDLAKHLKRPGDAVVAALDLLDAYGVLEFTGDGDDRAVRIDKGMR
jgi:hypothetical protein